MTSQVVPDEAVKAVARIIALDNGWDAESWDTKQITAKYRQRYFETALAALEAAAPHMLAEAWESGAEAQAKCYGMDKDTGPNPYRTAK